VYDALRSTMRAVAFRHNRECAACGAGAGAALDPSRYQVRAC
jgi:hypothetical protein